VLADRGERLEVALGGLGDDDLLLLEDRAPADGNLVDRGEGTAGLAAARAAIAAAAVGVAASAGGIGGLVGTAGREDRSGPHCCDTSEHCASRGQIGQLGHDGSFVGVRSLLVQRPPVAAGSFSMGARKVPV
jgi:hypothetical protein